MAASISITVWRHVPRGAHPLHLGRILKARGRWNRTGVYGAPYTSLTVEGARAELEKYRQQSSPDVGGVAFADRDLCSIQVTVTPVLDLTDADTIRKTGVDARDMLGDDDANLEKCHRIADQARSLGYRALLVPSAALDGAKNLVIYPDGPAHELQLEVGPDRIEL